MRLSGSSEQSNVSSDATTRKSRGDVARMPVGSGNGSACQTGQRPALVTDPQGNED